MQRRAATTWPYSPPRAPLTRPRGCAAGSPRCLGGFLVRKAPPEPAGGACVHFFRPSGRAGAPCAAPRPRRCRSRAGPRCAGRLAGRASARTVGTPVLHCTARRRPPRSALRSLAFRAPRAGEARLRPARGSRGASEAFCHARLQVPTKAARRSVARCPPAARSALVPAIGAPRGPLQGAPRARGASAALAAPQGVPARRAGEACGRLQSRE